jgi:DNA polymerase-1
MSGLNNFLMYEVELPLIPVVAAMENNGYPVDTQFFIQLRERLAPLLEQEKSAIASHAWNGFNANSHPQLSKLLFDELGLPITKRTDHGNPSTDNQALEPLRTRHEVVPHIIRFRELQKIVSTYCSVAEKADEHGRLRVEFNQCDAATGRFTSSSIIQTIPNNEEFAIRNGFRASPGHKIVAADFDQQEIRILAQESGDQRLRDAFANGLDVHGFAAVMLYGLSCQPNEVGQLFPQERRNVKALHFGIIYGKQPFSMGRELGISEADARKLFDDYFGTFPSVKSFIDSVHRRLMRHGFVDDLFGRRRHFPQVRRRLPRKPYNQMNQEEQALYRQIAAAKREAQNFVIQGAAATITKLAMIQCHRRMEEQYPDVRMILTLHDELQFEVPDFQVNAFATELPDLMCNLGLEDRFRFTVPMTVKVKVGPSMGELTAFQN